jgi:predicted nuclease of predicted toxin-antitoxin system
VKFLVDMPLSPELAVWLRGLGHDALHASDVGLHHASDAAIMQQAKLQERTIVTADLDYPQLLAVARASEPSVILFRDGNWSDSDVKRRLSDTLSVLTERDIAEALS